MKPLRLRARVALVLGVFACAALAAGWVRAAPGVAPVAGPATGMRVGYAQKHDLSPPLSSLPPARGLRLPPAVPTAAPGANLDLALPAMPGPSLSWDGISRAASGCECSPPDTNGAVGRADYVQAVNFTVQVWTKTGSARTGPVPIAALWAGFGSGCEPTVGLDPIVLYDAQADRWVLSALGNDFNDPNDICIAVSATGDPTGAWYRYAFKLSTNNYPDYPKLAIWPDGYYLDVNMQVPGSTQVVGQQPFVFDRAAMLQGQAAGFQTTAAPLPQVMHMLPADLDGPILPPAGAPDPFVGLAPPGGPPQLQLYGFHVDWAQPSQSTFNAIATLPVDPWTYLDGGLIPQPRSQKLLAAMGGFLMSRVGYRNFGDHESLVLNHTVAAGRSIAGVRWYEIRNPSSSPVLYQQGTYAPDSLARWLGSAAMDGAGDIALGFSTSSTKFAPAVRYAGRLATDPLGTLAQGEGTIIAATGVETGTTRWGHYSRIAIDPVDDCTFWYTNEYFAHDSYENWSTRIGAFRFPTCSGPPPTPVPSATPAPTPTLAPGQRFTDVPPGALFYTEINWCAAAGIIAGYDNGDGTLSFRPIAAATRAQVSKMLALAAGWPLDTRGGPHFTDVPPGSVFYPYIETAYNRGVLSGYSDGTFRPSNEVTRAQFAKLLVGTRGWPITTTGGPHFLDVPPANPFYGYVETAFAHGIISGYADNTFRPVASITRGQLAKMIYLAYTP
jgi:hypothetical protein